MNYIQKLKAEKAKCKKVIKLYQKMIKGIIAYISSKKFHRPNNYVNTNDILLRIREYENDITQADLELEGDYLTTSGVKKNTYICKQNINKELFDNFHQFMVNYKTDIKNKGREHPDTINEILYIIMKINSDLHEGLMFDAGLSLGILISMFKDMGLRSELEENLEEMINAMLNNNKKEYFKLRQKWSKYGI